MVVFAMQRILRVPAFLRTREAPRTSSGTLPPGVTSHATAELTLVNGLVLPIRRVVRSCLVPACLGSLGRCSKGLAPGGRQ
jgi:hypothetical protein